MTAEKAAEFLTMHSLEIESLEKTGTGFENVVVGELLEIKKHPNADKLQIVRVLTSPQPSPRKGEGGLNIVCGANNIKIGDKVPVALIGAELPNGLTIKEAEIRGEKSFGMLCAKDELGLGEDHSGIFILDKNAKIGEKAEKYLGIKNDTIFEIKVLPDRAHDAMSHVGVAREIAVLENRKLEYDFDGLKLPSKKSPPKADQPMAEKKLSVQINDKKLCPRYIGAIMTNVEIKPSPDWMQDRLNVCGIKAINNVVDATNYVMLELGQPLHAFDVEKIGNKIVIRRAKKNEKMQLLDETEIVLSENDLLITGGETPLALAGIMGGKNSGINENTKTIILEAANFKAVNIRRTRMRLGLRTESSDRFEKDIDPNLAEKAMVRIIEILEKIAGGKLEGIADIYPNKIKPWKIKLNLEYADSLLGEKIPRNNVLKILNLLGIKTTGKGKVILAEIPTYRLDLRTQEDLIEEVGRVWGYEKIKIQPFVEGDFSPKVNKQLVFERKIKKSLIGLGFDEMYNYSFYSERDAQNCALNEIKHFELANPINPDQQFVRVSLLPNILKNVKTNLKHFADFKIFEIGKNYWPDKNKVAEKRVLVMAQVLEKDKNSETFYEIKGALEDLLATLGLSQGSTFEILKVEPWGAFHSTRSAEIKISEETIGLIGEINPAVLAKYKIGKRVAAIEIDLEKLLTVIPKGKTFKPLQKFPTILRDISLLAKKETRAADIKNLIMKTGGDLVIKVEMFDVFVKDDQTSLAYHIQFGASERTLENQEVDKAMKKIISALEKDLKVEVRK